MGERGISGHDDGRDESTAWLGDYAHDAWTEDQADLARDDGDVTEAGDGAGAGDVGMAGDGAAVEDTGNGEEAVNAVGTGDAAASEEVADQEPDEPSHEDSRDSPPGSAPEGLAAALLVGSGMGPHEERGEDPGETRASPRWWLSPVFFMGALAGMLAIALVWALTAAGSDGTTRTASEHTAPGHRAGGTTGSTAAPSRSLAQRREQHCADTAAALAGALRVAGPALDQWEVHVGAMNKLVVGAISLQQANQFWNQTRVGAQERLARFRAADRRATGRSGACPSPGHLGHAPAALRSCARIVAGDREALTAARRSIDTWSHHVRDMEMLRMGHMSPTMATQMWLASWKQGVRELGEYRAAVRAEHRRRCPS